MNYKILSDVTNILGFQAAEINKVELTFSELASTINDMNNNNIKFAYWETNSVGGDLAEAFGGEYVSDKILYSGRVSPLNKLTIINQDVIAEECTHITDDIKNLAIQAGLQSGLYVDKNFPHDFNEKLTESFLYNPINKVFVAKINEKPIGLLILTEKEGKGNVSTLFVSENMRKNKIATILLNNIAEDWCSINSLKFIQIVISGDNIPAKKLCEKCWLKEKDYKKIYYFWLRRDA